MSTIKNYLSLVKFSHTIFAMPFAMIGFFLGVAEKKANPLSLPESMGWYGNYFWIQFLLVVLCMVFARSAAMGFNRYLDRSFDALNPRTAAREIPAGIISADKALLFTVVNSVFFIGTTLLINRACFILSPVALAVVLGYSYTKRFTALCHLVLGVGLSLAPIGAFLAVTGYFAWLPILFSFAVIFWVSGFDIIYALQDESFDKSQHLHSIPAAVGKKNALHISEFLHLLSATCVVTAGVQGHFGWTYWLGVAVFIGMLLYQHSVVKPNDLTRVNLAFMTANGIASVVFAVFVIADLFFHTNLF
ncbi:UbiA-like polyprenyltransferase [Flavihumibacter petaseus]|uniref:4-hydroxybenzoate polyprenyltransferase n=1 Tax=Flavihumibacter petaseus NBRC 106054 TaxID=1220578 RepID=A0A0E9N2N9_9BACT|nr:UbiA-like polyprenyltransferase [Flavihumibacter petaseus]GAO43595.1 putative 4-hydroxybenzoate octaprenyltransferase [Flavihumibacter petaseus NBRC 106054]